MIVKLVRIQGDLPTAWDNLPMGRNGVAPGIFNSDPVKSRSLTLRIACDIIPPLKASALWSRDGLEAEGLCIWCP